MEHPLETQSVQSGGRIAPITSCKHGRLIDDILTRSGKRTGKVRCLECGTVIDDPYLSR